MHTLFIKGERIGPAARRPAPGLSIWVLGFRTPSEKTSSLTTPCRSDEHFLHADSKLESVWNKRQLLTSSLAGETHRIWSQINLGSHVRSASLWPLLSLSLRSSSVTKRRSIICLVALLWDPMSLVCDNPCQMGGYYSSVKMASVRWIGEVTQGCVRMVV